VYPLDQPRIRSPEPLRALKVVFEATQRSKPEATRRQQLTSE
jgi:hypothetical protein